MQKSGKNNTLIIVLAVVGVLALGCCGITIGGGVFGFRAAMDMVNKERPFVSGLLTKLSDANYDPTAIDADLEMDADSKATLKSDLAAAGAKLGKFKKLTEEMPTISSKSSTVNGKSTSSVVMTFTGEFEKGTARVEISTSTDSGTRKIRGLEFRQ